MLAVMSGVIETIEKSIEAPVAAGGRWRLVLHASVLSVLGAVIGTISTCSPQSSLLDQIRNKGVLRVASVNSPLSYSTGPDGEPMGFDYDLAKAFADSMGVRLEMSVTSTSPEAAQRVLDGKADLAAAEFGHSLAAAEHLRFSRPLREATLQLVYRSGRTRPRSLDDLEGRTAVVFGSTAAERLRALKVKHPGMHWREVEDVETEELLFQVAEGEIDYTVASSALVSFNRRFHPSLRIAFDLGAPETMAWAFSAASDSSLSDAVEAFFAGIGGAELARVRDRYFGHLDDVDPFDTLMLVKRVKTRLPLFRKDFEEAAQRTGLDWRLLAAVGYQESHWDPEATSPTGVRGVMMLTKATAELLGIADRTDPRQSVLGGSAYLRMLLDSLPSQITEPDRTWLALAAYNLGLGHLLDARELTLASRADPDRWPDVRAHLPLLARAKFHSRTQYGYARGYEAVSYVGNVRSYYDLLVWLFPRKPVPTAAKPAPATADHLTPTKAALPQHTQEHVPENAQGEGPQSPLDIDSPIP